VIASLADLGEGNFFSMRKTMRLSALRQIGDIAPPEGRNEATVLNSTQLLKSISDLLSTLAAPVPQDRHSAWSPGVPNSLRRLIGCRDHECLSGIEQRFASDLEAQANSIADLRSAFASVSARQSQIETRFCERMGASEKALATLRLQSVSIEARATASAGAMTDELKRLRQG
jgi:hypothetical protein